VPSFEKCRNCGAPLDAAADGRSVQCAYCGARETRTVDATRLAEALRAEAGSTVRLFETLAERLEREMPDLARVERRGGFLTSKRVESVEVGLAGRVFKLRRDGPRVVAERGEVVRGIVLKTNVVGVDEWLQSLCEALSAHAGTSAQALDALRRIGG
jgi:uncharacterized Zn finger protein (UPF0148 family)